MPGGAVLVSALVTAGVQVSIEPGVPDAPRLEAAAHRALNELTVLWRQVTAAEPPALGALVVRPATGLEPNVMARSRLGEIALRPGLSPEEALLAVRHEVAHQLLWRACPQAEGDRLFHEAFAVAVSGELSAWTAPSAGYLSTPEAKKKLTAATSLDSPSSRRALARLVLEGTRAGDPLAVPLARRLRQCAAGAAWRAGLSIDELSSLGLLPGTAFVVLSRHSGEVLVAEGEASRPLPYGSTLKPFLLAGAASTPRLAVDARRPEWRCAQGEARGTMSGAEAVLASCNGYFLDWERAAAGAKGFGDFGPLLLALGLERLPSDMSEAIGIVPALSLSPFAMAQAYRALGAARPDVVQLLRDNAARGTLAGLPVSKALQRFATKTGTVRDADSGVELGWIVAMDEDVVAVMAAGGQMPRSLAGKLLSRLEELAAVRATSAAQVQVLGLVPPVDVEARCAGVTFLGAGRLGAKGWVGLSQLVSGGPALCLGAPFQLRFPGLPPEGREYAGSFAARPLPPAAAPTPLVSERAQKARRGSDLVFTTTLERYAAGVLRSEDAAIGGEARAALLKVVAHNAGVFSRHDGRPVCDTTHCQVFQGTTAADSGDRRLLMEPLSYDGWLTFSRGGGELWTAERSTTEVERVLGPGASSLRFGGGRVRFVRLAGGPEDPHDAAQDLPCELLRAPLKLMSCPERAEPTGAGWRFSGRGAGHGEGLDLEWAKASGLGVRAILEVAYTGRRR